MKSFSTPIIAAVTLFLGYAQPVVAQAQQGDISSTIIQKDSAFWAAYNRCDVAGMDALFTEDVEFYHDKGGATTGLATLSANVKKGMCGTPGYKLRREAVAGTVQVFPMYSNGAVYGALISGEHIFYVTDGGKPEYLDGHARFTQLWVLRGGEWKMSRVLSYDHKPAVYQNKRQEVQLSRRTLNKLEGTYNSNAKGPIVVKRSGSNLHITVGGQSFALFAANNHSFFIKERDLTFEFGPESGQKIEHLTIRENGAVVERATLRQL